MSPKILPLNNYPVYPDYIIELQEEIKAIKAQLAQINTYLMTEKSHDLNTSTNILDKRFLFVKDQNVVKRIRLEDIIMVKADSNYSEIYISDGKKLLTSKTLHTWGQSLENSPDIIRIHRSYLINKQHVLNILSADGEVELTDGLKAKFSRRYRSKIKF